MKARHFSLVFCVLALCGVIVAVWFSGGHETVKPVTLGGVSNAPVPRSPAQNLEAPGESIVECEFELASSVDRVARANASEAPVATRTWGRIFGRIVDAAMGAPMPEHVEVKVGAKRTGRPRTAETLQPVERLPSSVKVNRLDLATGSAFDYSELAFGLWTVSANVAGYAPWTREVELTEAEPEVQIEIALAARRTLRVLIRDLNGRPPWQTLSDAGVADTVTFIPRITSTCGRRGENVDGLGLQTAKSRYVDDKRGEPHWEVDFFRVTACCVVLMLGERVFDAHPVGPLVDEVSFTITLDDVLQMLGTLNACVRMSTTGQPIAGAELCIAPNSNEERIAVSDERGCIPAFRFMPGRWPIEVRAQGCVTKRVQVDVEPGAALDVGVIALDPTGVIRGTLLNRDGTARSGRVYARVLADGMPTNRADSTSVWADRAGSFAFESIERAQYVLADQELVLFPGIDSIGKGEVEGAILVDARNGSVFDVRLTARDREPAKR